MRRYVYAAFVPLFLANTPAAEQAALDRGRALTGQFAAADTALARRLSPEMLALLGGAERAPTALKTLRDQIGPETALIEERVYADEGRTTYYRVFKAANLPSVTAQYSWTGDGTVVGMGFQPTATAAASDKLDYQTRASLRLPFARPGAGEWTVVWGGRDPIANYHAVAPDQRFALDLIVTRNGKAFSGDGTRSENHLCWGQPLLSPAAGRVVRAVGDQPDNLAAGSIAEGATGPGNHVLVDHGGGEYSLIAHLRQGSLAVKPGQQVASGALVGRCGNSGRSSQPHLHYHLQDGAADRSAKGLPAQFVNFERNGQPVPRGEPVRGDRINPSAAKR